MHAKDTVVSMHFAPMHADDTVISVQMRIADVNMKCKKAEQQAAEAAARGTADLAEKDRAIAALERQMTESTVSAVCDSIHCEGTVRGCV